MLTPKLSNKQSPKIKKNPLEESKPKENKKPITRPIDFLEDGISEGNQISVENLNGENDA